MISAACGARCFGTRKWHRQTEVRSEVKRWDEQPHLRLEVIRTSQSRFSHLRSRAFRPWTSRIPPLIFAPGSGLAFRSLATVSSSVTWRETRDGPRKRLSNRERGEVPASCPPQRLHVQLGAMEAFLLSVHTVLLPGRT